MMMGAYKFTLPDFYVAPEIFSEVKVIHELENQSQWVLGGGIHSNKWHNIRFIEATTRQHFVVEPLQRLQVNGIRSARARAAYRVGR